MCPTATALRLPRGTSRCARCRSGGRSFCRALKSHTGAFSLAPLCQPPPLRRGLWQRARSAAAAWRHPPLRPVAPLAPSSVSRQGLRKRSSLAPLPVAPSRAFPLLSARSGAVVRRCGLLSLRRSPRSVPRPRSPHAVPPVASLFCRSRSSAGGLSRSPLAGSPARVGALRAPPPSYSAAPWAALFLRFPSVCAALFLSLRCGAGVTTPRPPQRRVRCSTTIPRGSTVSLRHIVNYRHGVGGLGVFPQSPQQLFKAFVFLCCAQH